MVDDVLEAKHFDLSRRRQFDLLVEVARQAVLNLVHLLSLLLDFFGEFVFLIDQNTNVLSYTHFDLVVFMDLSNVKMQTHELHNALLTE